MTGDINIDIIKFENDETCYYSSTLLSYRYLPYITLPNRITIYAATWIDHTFIKPARNNPSLINDIVCGLLYCDISDHLPCFVSLITQITQNTKYRPKTRIFGGKNCQKFVTLMEFENWEDLYTHGTNWYEKFITNVKKNDECFPLVRTSRKRFKDKPWLMHSSKACIQKRHKLYKTHLRNISENTTRKCKAYRNVLTKCLRKAEEMY